MNLQQDASNGNFGTALGNRRFLITPRALCR